MKTTLIALLLIVAVVGCERNAERQAPVSNGKFEVSLLFTDENGCKVYRFYDAGYWRYYVVGGVGTHWEETHSRGKSGSNTSSHEIPTVNP